MPSARSADAQRRRSRLKLTLKGHGALQQLKMPVRASARKTRNRYLQYSSQQSPMAPDSDCQLPADWRNSMTAGWNWPLNRQRWAAPASSCAFRDMETRINAAAHVNIFSFHT